MFTILTVVAAISKVLTSIIVIKMLMKDTQKKDRHSGRSKK